MWARRTLADAFSPRDNSFGFLRLFFAFLVLLSHTYPLGYGRDDPGAGITNGQAELGEIGIIGFFVISGFLITRSGLRFGLGRFLWHRALRILPGFWVCLAFTAFVLAPLVALLERGNLRGFWSHSDGPVQYVVKNLFVAMQQYGISDLLRDTPYAHRTGDSVFDGSLWSLMYEVGCYFMIGGLALVGVLKRAKVVVLVMAAAGFAVMVYDLIQAPHVPGPQGIHGPVFGFHGLDRYSLIYLTYLFLLGAVFELYKNRIVMNDAGAVLAVVVVVATVELGGVDVLGYPAFAYLILWSAIRLPKWLRGIGRRQDYSYGFYIYAFPVQQLLVLFGVPDWGLWTYALVATVGTFALAVPSWHLVERPAMRFKDWTPRWAQRTTAGDQASGMSTREAPEPSAAATQTSLAEGPSPARGRP
ncbi:acyltransferase family protein [Dactylosporangium sp. McL0621]|uniref:acyltransferase family protein n=1 Tax=Dactylosporangium sp. McL0621 TaxID=3415678 RepID=UPI003CF60DEC